jgi:predicted polyphosphate/ATP-dependent NAD kinase
MPIVGIIANPSAGRDIRRLVAHASVFDNNEKVNIVRRVLLGLDAVGVQQVWIMPDAYHIGRKALDNLRLRLEVRFVEMQPRFEESDSTEAAAHMIEVGVRTLVTLGGDGTNRAVAKASGRVPIMPISTGTNNAFPIMVEGTLAGLAAGLTATGAVPSAIGTESTKRIELWDGQGLVEIALVDAVVYRSRFIGSRAVWNMDEVEAAVFARAKPTSIGLSAIGGFLMRTPLTVEEGLYIELGAGGMEVLAPVAPGVIRPVSVKAHRRLRLGESVSVDAGPAVIALDGERKFILLPGQKVNLSVSAEGPVVVHLERTLDYAAQQGLFVSVPIQASS